ncbi:MAG TPA: MBL fold metallo-hydrolase, partial [Burkholderiales bacterium]|nr:MBL fold metallo-hydrolase [Burkholderiales bacterium]
ILDAGTGIYQLSQSLLKEMPVDANLFLTHSHWDHIQGLPFFIPLFVPGNRLRIHGAYDVVSNRGVEQVMDIQLQYSFFPIREAELKAAIEYATISPGAPVKVGDAIVTPILLNHPVVNFGYRIDCGNKSVFFTGDHEPHQNIYSPEDAGFAEYNRIIAEREADIRAAIRGVDVIIADSSYTAEEYPHKRGWGHGSYESSIRLARESDAKILYFTHHEPTRSDEELEAIFAAQPPSEGIEYRLAREGEGMSF